jgi:hypothetical protein
MIETYYAAAYWGPRKESPEACAQRAQAFLQCLSQCDVSLSRWYQPARTRKKSLERPLTHELEQLADMFRRGVNRTDGDKSIIEDLGFHFATTNCEPEGEDTFVRVKCGVYSKFNHNFCVLNLPDSGPNAQRVLTTPVLMNVVRCMARAWEPDWALAMSHAHRDIIEEQQGRTPHSPYAAWVTYLSRTRGTVPPLPAPVRIELVDSLGTLIALTPERFTAATPEHLDLSSRVRELLERAKLLGPLVR